MRWILIAATSFAGALAQPEPPAQPAAPPPATSRRAERFASAARLDLALAYLRFERALRASPPPDADIPDINRRFDQASIAFFSGRYNPAVETLAELTRSLTRQDPDPAQRAAECLRITPTSALIHAASAGDAALALEPLYSIGKDAAGPITLELALIDENGREAWRTPVECSASAGRLSAPPVPLAGFYSDKLIADLTITLKAPGQPAIPKGRISLRPAALEPLRKQLSDSLSAFTPATDEQKRARTTALARASLLVDDWSPKNSARFLAGLNALAASVEAETAAVLKGENPYRGLAGDHWRTVALDSSEIPCRVYAPARVAASTDPAPLIIAYHGAGGDEAMFFEGYGAGILRDLADQKGFIAVCPLTYSGGSPRALDRIIADLSADYRIDPARIYALGHSMGGGTVSSLAASRATTLAAACCIAGGGPAAPKEGPRIPMLIVSAELDPLFGGGRAKRAVEEARNGENAPELLEAKGWGHTLVVGAHLPRAVDWLLARRRP